MVKLQDLNLNPNKIYFYENVFINDEDKGGEYIQTVIFGNKVIPFITLNSEKIEKAIIMMRFGMYAPLNPYSVELLDFSNAMLFGIRA